jgi:hypothetical protein
MGKSFCTAAGTGRGGAALSESDVRDEVASEMRELPCQMEANYKAREDGSHVSFVSGLTALRLLEQPTAGVARRSSYRQSESLGTQTKPCPHLGSRSGCWQSCRR